MVYDEITGEVLKRAHNDTRCFDLSGLTSIVSQLECDWRSICSGSISESAKRVALSISDEKDENIEEWADKLANDFSRLTLT